MTRHRIPGLIARVIALGEAFVEVDPDVVRVRTGLSADIPRSSVRAAVVGRSSFWDGIGVHGWARRWVVNARVGPAAVLHVEPPARARVLGFPVRVAELVLGVEDPQALVDELAP